MAVAGSPIEAVLTLDATGFHTGLNDSLQAVKGFESSLTKFSNNTRNMRSSLQGLGDVLTQARDELVSFNNQVGNLTKFNQFAEAINKIANALYKLSKSEVDAVESMNLINNMFEYFKNTLNGVDVGLKLTKETIKELAKVEQVEAKSTEQVTASLVRNSEAMQQNAVTKLRAMGYTGQLSAEEQVLTSSEDKLSVSTDKATTSMERQNTATKSLGRGLGMLRSGLTLVGSMLAYNFIHKLGQATTETINAKSEMNGYFQMLGYGKGQVEDFNRALDETVKKFPRLNKYALGETISSIGVEFELSTKEMKKAMPVVSMITSEYLRAGRNVNEASLAVKDILQGEFQRLSRETGVKGDQLKEAGWSGDKNDVMGLLEALDKVGKSRNWDEFVMKANSLNDAVLIMQNRFSEWSADMVEKVQPMIVGVFNEIMQVASTFANHLNGVIDFISGNKFAQGIGWVAVAGSVLAVFSAFVKLRTGANLLQIAQMGLKNSIIASILQLDAETVASYGSLNAIIARTTGIDAEIVSEGNRLNAILASASGMEIEEVKEVGRLKTLGAIVFGLDTATLKEHGFFVALMESTTGAEASTIANWSLAESITAVGISIALPLAVIGAFTLAVGGLALQMYNSAESMKEFNKLVNQGDEIMSDAYATQRKYLDRQEKQSNTLKKLTRGTKEYNNQRLKLMNTNRLLDQAQHDVEESSKAITLARNSQEFFDTTREEKALELQGNLADAYIKAGMDSTVAYDMANESYRNAQEGADQLYTTLQGLNELDTKQLLENEYMLDLTEGMDSDRVKHYITEINKYQDMIHEGYEKGMTDESFFGRLDGWLTFYEGQIGNWFTNLSATVEKQDWGALWDNLWRGIAHGFADLPIFKDIWGYVFDQFNIKETYGGKGWSGLAQFFEDSANNIVGWFKTSFSNALTKNDISQYIFDVFDNMISTVEDGLKNLGSIDILGAIWDAILPSGVSASDGSSDHPSFMDDVSNIVGFDIQTWVTNFNNDPLGTLGIEIPQLDIWGLLSSLFGGNGDNNDGGGFDIGSWLSNIFNIDGIVSSFTTNLGTIFSTAQSIASNVSNVFNGLRSNIQGHLTNIVTNVSTGFENAKNYAFNKVTAMRDSVGNVVHQMTDAWKQMKDSILNSAKLIYDNVKKKFDDVGNTLKDFFGKLQDPSKWGAGQERWSRSPRPSTARRMFSKPSGGRHGAGLNPYTNPSKQVKLRDLFDLVDGDNKVELSQFLSLFSQGGFGGWDFHKPSQDYIYSKGKKWKSAPANIRGIGSVGNGYFVERFWNGKPKFTFDEFMATAEAVFSAIPYKFYYDSEWKGNWINALLSGATNCWDGSNALIALARVFGFDGYPVHTTTKDGTGHFYAVINGRKMDTTHFQHGGGWSPLGGAGVSPRPVQHGKTVNITVDMSNATVYGIEDLDSRIEDGVKKGLREEFNDPYSIAL